MAAVMGKRGTAISGNLEHLAKFTLVYQLLSFAVEGVPTPQTAHAQLGAMFSASGDHGLGLAERPRQRFLGKDYLYPCLGTRGNHLRPLLGTGADTHDVQFFPFQERAMRVVDSLHIPALPVSFPLLRVDVCGGNYLHARLLHIGGGVGKRQNYTGIALHFVVDSAADADTTNDAYSVLCHNVLSPMLAPYREEHLR